MSDDTQLQHGKTPYTCWYFSVNKKDSTKYHQYHDIMSCIRWLRLLLQY